jgi:hypothetical protein
MRMQLTEGARQIKVGSESRGLEAVYRADRAGMVDVSQRHADLMRKDGCATVANTAGPTAHVPGFVCSCGRRNYFKRCGACGSEDGVKQ